MALSRAEKRRLIRLSERHSARQDLNGYRALLEGTQYWECSRFARHHRHVFGLTATLCGLFQYLYHRLTGNPLCGNKH